MMDTKQTIFKVLSEYKKILEDKGYKVLYLGLYGSQNYNLDDELSDYDAKAIILPSLHDIIFRKVTSKTIDCENGSIDVKDLITFYDVIKKGNFSYIESIDTEYSIGDKTIKTMFKQFRPNLKSILGAMYEKRKALTHEYPSKKEEFEKWGFDPKQYHHIIRLYEMLNYEPENKSYLIYDIGETLYCREHMLEIKRNTNNLTKEFVEEHSDETIKKAKELIPDDYKYEPINLDKEISKYIEDNIKLELLKNSEVQSARQYRTFGTPIPKSDLKKFPILEEHNGKDVSYIVYESIEVL
ncbi:MAG TPA: hypothetical protein GX708_13135 [Gallicola sp.]|nr:hypothetical protein [Gallicola sp.]